MSNRSSGIVWLLVACVVLVGPGLAAACSVCTTGKEDDTRIAFELMTAFMTVIPFVLVGGAFWWLRGRLRALEESHVRARELAEASGSLPAAESPRSH